MVAQLEVHGPGETLPDAVIRLLWDVEPAALDPGRDRALIMERVMSRGSWDAMRWLRARYSPELLAELIRARGERVLSPRDPAYWALIAGVELPSRPGGGRPSWAGA